MLELSPLAHVLSFALLLGGPSHGTSAPVDDVRIEVEGVTGEPRTNVFATLSLQRAIQNDEPLDEDRLLHLHELADEEIARALEPFGYYRVTVESTLDRDAGGWVARYVIDRGPPVRISTLDVRIDGAGADEPLLRELEVFFPLAEGDVLVHETYEEAKTDLVDRAAELGYFDAAFTTKEVTVDLDAYNARVVLHYDTGPRYLFGEARFLQDFMAEDFLDNYVPFEPGEPFRLSRLLKLQSGLSSSPYFSRVEVVARPEEANELGAVPIDVHLEPGKKKKYSLGAGYGTDTGPRGTAGWTFRRLNRRGHRAEILLRGSQIEGNLGFSYLIPYAHPQADLLGFTVSYTDEENDTSASEAFHVGARISRQRGEWLEVFSLGYRYEDYAVGLDVGNSKLLLPGASWTRVKADNRILPSRGYRLHFELRGAEETLVSDSSLLQVSTDAKVVRSLGERQRVLARAKIGYLLTSEFRRLPPNLRFFAGGDESVRGFDYESIGRLDEAGNVIGGERLLVGSLEYELRVLEQWAAAVFVDAGSVGSTFGDDVRRGAGVGIRWRSPLGPVRADVAWGISEDDPPIRFHLSIGPDL